MKSDRHFDHNELIDFLEGEVSSGLADEIRNHLKTCETCRAYVDSLGRTFGALKEDNVPEQSPGYWDFFEQRVRERAKSARQPAPRRRLVFYWLPGLAAVALVILLRWLPEQTLPEVDPMEVFMADLSTGEIIESLSGSPAIGLMLLEADAEELSEIDEYIAETTDIYDLLEQLSEEERAIFISNLRENMKEEDNTSAVTDGSLRKGC
jgi:predicted anti-sigma-YlaC factor YlaD